MSTTHEGPDQAEIVAYQTASEKASMDMARAQRDVALAQHRLAEAQAHAAKVNAEIAALNVRGAELQQRVNFAKAAKGPARLVTV